jgi:hypothetical protein
VDAGGNFEELRAIHTKYEQRASLLREELNEAFESIKMYDQHVEENEDSYIAEMRDIHVERWRRTRVQYERAQFRTEIREVKSRTIYVNLDSPMRADSERTVQITRTEAAIPIVEKRVFEARSETNKSADPPEFEVDLVEVDRRWKKIVDITVKRREKEVTNYRSRAGDFRRR